MGEGRLTPQNSALLPQGPLASTFQIYLFLLREEAESNPALQELRPRPCWPDKETEAQDHGGPGLGLQASSGVPARRGPLRARRSPGLGGTMTTLGICSASPAPAAAGQARGRARERGAGPGARGPAGPDPPRPAGGGRSPSERFPPRSRGALPRDPAGADGLSSLRTEWRGWAELPPAPNSRGAGVWTRPAVLGRPH